MINITQASTKTFYLPVLDSMIETTSDSFIISLEVVGNINAGLLGKR